MEENKDTVQDQSQDQGKMQINQSMIDDLVDKLVEERISASIEKRQQRQHQSSTKEVAIVGHDDSSSQGVNVTENLVPEPVQTQTRSVDLIPPDQMVHPFRSVQMHTRNQSGEEGEFYQTAQMFSGLVYQNPDAVHEARARQAEAGNYGEQVREQIMKVDRENRGRVMRYHTQRLPESGIGYHKRAAMLTSLEGAPFLPITVLNRIENITKQFGVTRLLTNVIPVGKGSKRVPASTGDVPVFAVNEGTAMKTRIGAFASDLLEPKKYGSIIPWSRELDDEIGPIHVQNTLQKVGEGFAKKQDEAVFTADGTAAFHSLTGLLQDGTIPAFTMAAGNTAFTDITLSDIVQLMGTVSSTVRKRGVFVFHPDTEITLLNLKDADGRFLLDQTADSIRTIRGRPIRFSEALPSVTAVSTAFGVFGDFQNVTFGTGRPFSAERLVEGTIQDTDDVGTLNLATQDLQALRFTQEWDVARNLTGFYAVIKTAAV